MKIEEQNASSLLSSCFSVEPTYEPLGRSKPPDFSIRNMAFEVRRLNESLRHADGRVEGLEELERRLNQAVTSELGKIPFSEELGSFAVMLRYSRKRKIEPAKVGRTLAKKAGIHYSSGLKTNQTIDAYGVEVRLIHLSRAYGKAFLRSVGFDEEGGGLVGEIYRSNITIAAQDKIRKTKTIADRFEQWFLILVDFITPEIPWLNDLGHLSLDLEHFNGIIVISLGGDLLMEYPKDSLKRLL